MKRRFGPASVGPGWSPSISSSTGPEDHADLDREVEALGRCLEENGELSRRDLRDAAGCKHWGPGRFGRALREAEERGAIRRTGRGRYGPA